MSATNLIDKAHRWAETMREDDRDLLLRLADELEIVMRRLRIAREGRERALEEIARLKEERYR